MSMTFDTQRHLEQGNGEFPGCPTYSPSFIFRVNIQFSTHRRHVVKVSLKSMFCLKTAPKAMTFDPQGKKLFLGLDNGSIQMRHNDSESID